MRKRPCDECDESKWRPTTEWLALEANWAKKALLQQLQREGECMCEERVITHEERAAAFDEIKWFRVSSRMWPEREPCDTWCGMCEYCRE